jgi:hypothetical protein
LSGQRIYYPYGQNAFYRFTGKLQGSKSKRRALRGGRHDGDQEIILPILPCLLRD